MTGRTYFRCSFKFITPGHPGIFGLLLIITLLRPQPWYCTSNFTCGVTWKGVEILHNKIQLVLSNFAYCHVLSVFCLEVPYSQSCMLERNFIISLPNIIRVRAPIGVKSQGFWFVCSTSRCENKWRQLTRKSIIFWHHGEKIIAVLFFTTRILSQEVDPNNVMMKVLKTILVWEKTHESRRPVLVPERRMQSGFRQVKRKFLDVFSTIYQNLFKFHFFFPEIRKY